MDLRVITPISSVSNVWLDIILKLPELKDLKKLTLNTKIEYNH